MLDRPITRRRLLGAAGGGVVLLGVPSGALARRRTRRADVVVVGAGFAGLTAARELVHAGKSVVVLEARHRVGGRALNKELGHGVVTERGATFIGPTQDRIAALAQSMGVGTFPTYDQGSNVYLHDGTRTTYDDKGITGTAPPDKEIFGDIATAAVKIDQMAREVTPGSPWTAPRAGEWDNQTFEAWVRANTDGNPRFLKLLSVLTRAAAGSEPKDPSLLWIVNFVAASGDQQNPGTLERNFDTHNGAQESRFHGGSQLVAKRVAHRLGGRVILGSPVRRIVRQKHGVRVESDRAIVHAKHVVVALPPALTARIDYSPRLPKDRRALAAGMPQGTLTKVAATYERPFWRDDGLTGTALSLDGLVGSTFDDSPPDASRGILFGFVGGAAAGTFNAMPRSQRRARVLKELADAFGPKAKAATGYLESNWRRERWTRGCPLGYALPHTLTRHGPALRAPAGRIHWAGTETADYWSGYMDGAVRSGERVAAEVLARL